MKQFRSLITYFALVVLMLGFVAVGDVNAQGVTGDVIGTVLDKSGAAVPNADIEALDPATGVKHPSTTNDTGEYRLSNLPPGTYEISASAPNFATTTVTGVKVDLNRTVTMNITLELKTTTTSIEVLGGFTALDTTTSTIDNTFEKQQLANLPQNSVSGILNLSLLGAGVSNAGGLGAGSGPSIGGQRPRNNNFTVEGLDNNSKTVTGPLVPIPTTPLRNSRYCRMITRWNMGIPLVDN